MKKCIFISAFLTIVSCSDSERTISTLQDEGYTNIQTEGHAWYGCGHDDQYCTAFTAIGPSGRHVHGAVGCGVGCGKGCTVRIR